MNYEIRTLTDRFFDGDTTLAEEQHLYELYRSAETLPDDLAPLREMMLDLAALRQPHTTGTESRVSHGHTLRRPATWRWLSMAASLLLLFALGSAWYAHRQQDELVAYVYGHRTTDREVVMQEVQQALASLADDEATIAMETQMKEMFTEE